MNGVTQFKCGHRRTNENTKVVRAGEGTACLTCFREHNRKYIAEKRAVAKGLDRT